MGVRPREGRLGDTRLPAPWCRGVARAREDAGLARGRDECGGSRGAAAEASAVAAMSSLPIRTYAADGQPAFQEREESSPLSVS